MNLKLTPTFVDMVEMPPVRSDGAGTAVEPEHEPGEAYKAIYSDGVVAPKPLEMAPQAKRRVAIIGTAPSSRDLAPYNDQSWEIWVCSPGNMNAVSRVTRWYELHCNLLWPEHKHYGEPYIKWLSEQKFPVYMQDQSCFPHAITFPKDQLVKEFGPYFFTSSFAWMMAQAILEGADEIGLWGVDMASREEYILQRPGGHYFIQEAKKRGIKITIPFESDLEQPPGLYAFSESTPFLRKIHARETELKSRIANMETQFATLKDQMTYLKGALEDIDYVRSIWSGAQEGLKLRDCLPK